ncbi:unnamed protein product [Thelazia callipaeda]|uniref:CNDH2_C domain-containing protein n=1 Tax=Thelazia callipaeda TaxID=103827 RepID=A0A0N5D9Z4_THECL|nr:unnamed protein product [Thelazia callipaeda]
MESKSIDTTCIKDDDESDELDEFFDATDKSFDCGNSDFYDDDVQFISQEPCLYYDQIKEDYDELALMLNSTLASEYNGANAARIIAHFFSDWKIVLENKANDMGFPDVDALLKHCDYIEQVSFVNGCAVYRAACKPENEHILQRVADCYLEEHQKNEKRRIQKLIELKNPENAKNYIEGKRRILQILMDLNAYEIDVDYEFVRKEYMRRYEVSLNSSEHHRLFMNRSASKNLCRVFVQEVTITSYNPIHLRLKSASVKMSESEMRFSERLFLACSKKSLTSFFLACNTLSSSASLVPDEINEDLQILASSENIELPTFPTKNQSCLPVAVPKKSVIHSTFKKHAQCSSGPDYFSERV